MSRGYGLKFSSVYKYLVFLLFFMVGLSGVLWLMFDNFVTSVTQFGVAKHPMQSKILAIHGVCALCFLFVFGQIWERHIKKAFDIAKKNRKSGIFLCGILIVLSVTGMMLYYASNEVFRLVLSYVHWVVGVVCCFVFVWHVLNIKYRRGGKHHSHHKDHDHKHQRSEYRQAC